MLSLANIVLGIQFAAAITLALVLIRRQLHRRLPIFFSYVIYSIAATAIQWVCISNRQLYFKVYWITEAGDIALAVAAVWESFMSTFRGFFVLAWFRLLLPGLAVLVACYAGWKAWSHPPVLNSPLVALVVGLEIGLRYFIAGAFIVYVAVRTVLKISDSRFQYNVILGFFLGSCGMLLAAVLRSEFGTKFPLVIAWAQPVAYSVALFVWLVSSVTPLADEEQRAGSHISAGQAFEELRQYSSALKKVGK